MPQLVPGKSDAGLDAGLAERVTAHLVGVIERTAVESEPFAHQVLVDPLPPADYRKVLEALPADHYYRELMHYDARLPDGRSARLQFPLLPANIRRLPGWQRSVWLALAAGFTDVRVVEAYRKVFAATLAQVSGRAPGSLRLRPYLTLFRDLGGYRISIHPDSPRKAITTQYYLPSDESQLHLGTLFHARAADGSYTLARAMRFAPNTGYAFAVCPSSFHSVSPMRPEDRPRNSLMLIIQHDRGPVVEGFRSARGQLRALWDRLRGDVAEPREQGEGRVQSM
ncbi:MAG TPA: hypothetical protein DEH78_26025 [Solibacterales bacterium]|nr:hypothetical protein [Bryobacterales bacterium]